MNKKAFKEYDIRGVYPEEVNEETAYKVGRAFVGFLKKSNPEVVIARDGRTSSESLFSSLKKGVSDGGGTAVDIGLSTTPMFNFFVCKNKYSGGIMVTASHNPPCFNGLKIVREKGFQIHGKELQSLREQAEKISEKLDKKQKEIVLNPLSDYVSHITSFGKNIGDIKVVVDYGNSVSSITGVPVFEKLKVRAINLYKEVDGKFPNHNPEPKIENASELVKTIKKENAAVGVFFDGDGDRVLFFDDKGELIPTDALISFLIKKELQENQEKKVYLDLCFSKTTFSEVEKNGGKAVMMRVGSPFYREKLITEGGLLGAELSGHIMHKDNFYIDDGLFAAVKVLDVLSQRKESLSELIKPFKNYHRTEEINIAAKNKDEVLKKVEESFSEGKKIDIDGVYIEFSDWWFNLRRSNTEDFIRLVVEAKTKESLKEKTKQVVDVINQLLL
jgi:phosphomannomutase